MVGEETHSSAPDGSAYARISHNSDEIDELEKRADDLEDAVAKDKADGTGKEIDPEKIKVAYESNDDTNAFTDDEKSDLADTVEAVTKDKADGTGRKLIQRRLRLLMSPMMIPMNLLTMRKKDCPKP